MRRLALTLAASAALAGCAQEPKMVMMNPRTGATVGCEEPDRLAGSGEFLISRACLSACQAHGFRPVPGVQTTGPAGETPAACLN